MNVIAHKYFMDKIDLDNLYIVDNKLWLIDDDINNVGEYYHFEDFASDLLWGINYPEKKAFYMVHWGEEIYFEDDKIVNRMIEIVNEFQSSNKYKKEMEMVIKKLEPDTMDDIPF